MMELLAHLSHLLHLLRHHAECERSPSSLRQATITTIVCINDDAEGESFSSDVSLTSGLPSAGCFSITYTCHLPKPWCRWVPLS